MKHLFVPVVALIVGASCPPALAHAWDFQFSHLCDGDTCIDVSGRFAGVDTDANGHISTDELQLFDAGGWSFRPGGAVHAFDYAVGANDFSAMASVGGYRISVVLVVGDQFSVIAPGFDPAGQFLWNALTTVSITSVVPEQSSCALMSLGLLGLAWQARRRAAKRGPLQ